MFNKEQYEQLATIKQITQEQVRKEFKEEIDQLTKRLEAAEKEIERLKK